MALARPGSVGHPSRDPSRHGVPVFYRRHDRAEAIAPPAKERPEREQPPLAHSGAEGSAALTCSYNVATKSGSSAASGWAPAFQIMDDPAFHNVCAAPKTITGGPQIPAAS
ncbi:unnamed protein product [Phytophthora fragariaefolia]|uniref:Unnamed protein product n=1 Tax=Phytophthora fragariaefolia TaxID=1490495 RepID=A0A9W6XKJ4_9STRA|nr:unnamed protein product [Phytophthora fragariaefolia]